MPGASPSCGGRPVSRRDSALCGSRRTRRHGKCTVHEPADTSPLQSTPESFLDVGLQVGTKLVFHVKRNAQQAIQATAGAPTEIGRLDAGPVRPAVKSSTATPPAELLRTSRGTPLYWSLPPVLFMNACPQRRPGRGGGASLRGCDLRLLSCHPELRSHAERNRTAG